MVESVRIDRVTGTDVGANANTVVTLLEPPVYAGKAKIQTYEPYEQERTVAVSQAVMQRYAVHVPVTVAGVRVGDYVTVTTGGVDGRVLRVAGTSRKTFQTAQRLLCDEITGGLVP